MKQGWEIKKLGDVCELYQPKTISSKEMVDDGEYPVFGANGIIGKYDKYNHEEPQLLITCRGATCGSVNISEPKSWINGNAMVVRPIDNSLNLKFIEYLFRGGIDISKTITGAAQPQITRQTLSPVLISYPKSLPEQQRIVSILDEAFAVIAKAKANAEQNLKNAKELFESYLQGVFENGNWETRTIQEITKVINGYAFASKDFKSTNTIKSIKITNVGVKEFVEEVDNYLPEKFKDTLKEVQVREGNIVIALTRTIISAGLKVAVVPASYDGALVNQRVAALVPNEKIINQRYLYNFLTTDGVAKYVLAHVNTLMQPNLSINDLKNLPVPCPTIKEQSDIVKKLDGLRSEVRKLEAIYQQKINDLEELKKSVLQKAFSGELRSPEGAKYTSDAATPIAKKKTITSPARA